MVNNTLSHLSQTCIHNLNNHFNLNNKHFNFQQNNNQTNIQEQLTTILDTLNQFKQQLQPTTNIPVFKLLKQSSIHLNSLIHAQSYIQQQQQQQLTQKPRSTYLDPASTTDNNTLTLALIEALAHEIKLESFRDSEDSLNLLTIAGKLFVIDIEILDNKVHRSKFSYTFAEEEAKRDLAIDHELTQQLQNIHLPFHQPDQSYHLKNLLLVKQSLRAFATSLRQLKEIDQLMTISTPCIDYFMIFRKLINDYHHHHSSSHDSSNRILSPSGIPLTSPNQLKLDLIYHYNSTQLIKQAIENKSTQGLAISIALTPSSQDKALFTAHFSPPLPASRFTAAALVQLSNSNLQSTPDPHPSWSCVETPPPPGEVFLEDLLVDQAMNSSPLSRYADYWNIHNCNWKSKQFGKVSSCFSRP